MKTEPFFKEGDVVKIAGQPFECTFVSWRDRDGEKENFTYSFQVTKKKEKK